MKRLFAVAVVAIFWGGGVAHAETPDRVKAMCGDQPVPWESLCNVDPDLREAFVWIERIGGDPDFVVRNRLSAMIRDRHAAIDWHPNRDLPSIHPNVAGLYNRPTSRVYLAQALRGEPLRVKASFLAHELSHAIWEVDNLGAGMSAALSCLSSEALAYQVEKMIYARVYLLTGEGTNPRTQVDRAMMADILDAFALSGGQQLTREGLDQLTARHLMLGGYVERCAQLG